MFDEAFANSYWHSIKPYTCIASKVQHCIDRKSWLIRTSCCMPPAIEGDLVGIEQSHLQYRKTRITGTTGQWKGSITSCSAFPTWHR